MNTQFLMYILIMSTITLLPGWHKIKMKKLHTLHIYIDTIGVGTYGAILALNICS